MSSSSSTIPIIDARPLLDADAGREGVRRTVRAIAAAGRSAGFFYLENHGLPHGLHDRMFADVKRFFGLSQQDKMDLFVGRDPSHYAGGYIPLGDETTQQLKDWHEALDIQPSVDAQGVSRSPFENDPAFSRLPWLVETFSSAWAPQQHLAYRLAAGIALGLDLPEDYFSVAIRDPLGVIRLSHYPVPGSDLPSNVGEGMGPHTDYGFLTMISQDGIDGLEVRDANGDWIPAPHRDGALMVLLGKVVQRWTNDRYQAAWHRVRSPRERARYSVGYFFEPGYNTVIEPLPICSGADNPPRYERCNFGQLMALRYEVSFGSYQQASSSTHDRG